MWNSHKCEGSPCSSLGAVTRGDKVSNRILSALNTSRRRCMGPVEQKRRSTAHSMGEEGMLPCWAGICRRGTAHSSSWRESSCIKHAGTKERCRVWGVGMYEQHLNIMCALSWSFYSIFRGGHSKTYLKWSPQHLNMKNAPKIWYLVSFITNRMRSAYILSCIYQNPSLLLTRVSNLKSKVDKHIFLFNVCHCVMPLFKCSLLGKSHSHICSEINFSKYVFCINIFLFG